MVRELPKAKNELVKWFREPPKVTNSAVGGFRESRKVQARLFVLFGNSRRPKVNDSDRITALAVESDRVTTIINLAIAMGYCILLRSHPVTVELKKIINSN